ncbi:MAG: nucleotidyltransferase domain-containing protein [Clostridia bacterium]|nr:nucleotidyltransferase domain-containing protein [Clostridia bacterium]
MSELKRLRIEKKLTQKQASAIAGISLRSYKSYENDEQKQGTMKYNYLVETLLKVNPIDEEHGIVDVNYIQSKCAEVFQNYEVEYCYLFGSYAKEMANEKSDIDLLISCNVKGLKYFGMVEELRTKLNKKVDALDINQLNNNMELVREILKTGVKIYG